MRFAAIYIRLKLKELFCSKVYIGFTAFILLLAAGMALLMPRADQTSPYTIALLNQHDTLLGEAVIEVLTQDGGYTLRICEDRRELEAMVLSGEVLCGYDFDKEADRRIEKGRYTGLINSFYREKSPAAALCDEAVCGAAFGYLAPWVSVRYLEQNKLGGALELQALRDGFGDAVSDEKMMKVTLLGAQGQEIDGEIGSTLIRLLYSLFCSLTAVFAIVTAFYTQSIDKSLVFAGQKPLLVGLCSFLSYSISYLVILSAAHLITVGFMPVMQADGGIIWQIISTSAVGGILQMLSRRYMSPRVLPLLPFAAVLMAAATAL